METPQIPDNTTNARKSELDKFKIFYEFAATNREVRARVKSQGSNRNA